MHLIKLIPVLFDWFSHHLLIVVHFYC